MVIGKSAPCLSSGIGAFWVFEAESDDCLRLAGRWVRLVWSGLGEFWAEGPWEDENSMPVWRDVKLGVISPVA